MKKVILRSQPHLLMSNILIPIIILLSMFVLWTEQKIGDIEFLCNFTALTIIFLIYQKYIVHIDLYKKKFIIRKSYFAVKKYSYSEIDKVYQLKAFHNKLICIVLKNKSIFNKYLFTYSDLKIKGFFINDNKIFLFIQNEIKKLVGSKNSSAGETGEE